MNICTVTVSASTAGGATAKNGMTTSASKAMAPHVRGADFTGVLGFLGVMAAL